MSTEVKAPIEVQPNGNTGKFPLPLHASHIKGDLPVSIPRTLGGFDQTFLTTVLRANGIIKPNDEVKSVDSKPLSIPGFVSSLCRLELTYSEGCTDAPATIIGKLTGGDLAEEKLKADAAAGLTETASAMEKPTGQKWKIMHEIYYPNEIRFFAQLDPARTEARIPACYFAGSRGECHALLLEDMGFCEFGDCREEATKEQARKVMIWLAKFHRAFWGKKKAGDGVPGDCQHVIMSADVAFFPLIMKIGAKPAVDILEYVLPEEYKKVASTLEYLSKRWKPYVKVIRSSTHQTAVHGDAHLENFVFHNDDAIGIDFGNAGWANPMTDVQYFLTKGIAHTEHRREWQEELLALYHATLTENGYVDAKAYSFETMMKDFRFYAISPLLLNMEHAKLVEKDIRNKEGFFKEGLSDPYMVAFVDHWYAGFRDSIAMCEEVKVLEMLEERVKGKDSCCPPGCFCFWLQ